MSNLIKKLKLVEELTTNDDLDVRYCPEYNLPIISIDFNNTAEIYYYKDGKWRSNIEIKFKDFYSYDTLNEDYIFRISTKNVTHYSRDNIGEVTLYSAEKDYFTIYNKPPGSIRTFARDARWINYCQIFDIKCISNFPKDLCNIYLY